MKTNESILLKKEKVFSSSKRLRKKEFFKNLLAN